jgi:hypothetical protein
MGVTPLHLGGGDVTHAMGAWLAGHRGVDDIASIAPKTGWDDSQFS